MERTSSRLRLAGARGPSVDQQDSNDINNNNNNDDDVSMSQNTIGSYIRPKMPDPTEHNPSYRHLNYCFDDDDTGDDDNDATRINTPQVRPRSIFLTVLGIQKLQQRVAASSARRPSLFGRDEIKKINQRKQLKPAFRNPIKRMSQIITGRVFSKKVVKINERKNEISGIERVRDLDAALIADVWFTKQEIVSMKQEMDLIAAAMDRGEINVDGRGLEGRTEQGNWLSYKARRDATNAVLDETDRQLREAQRGQGRASEFKLEDGPLRDVYLQVSVQYSEEALTRGLQDEKEAMEFLQETRRQHEAWKAQQLLLQQQQAASSNGLIGLVGITNDESASVPLPEQALAMRKRSQSLVIHRPTIRQQRSFFRRARSTFDSDFLTRPTPGIGLSTLTRG